MLGTLNYNHGKLVFCMRLGALEAGGTKMVCSVGCADGTILERASFETVRPELMFPTLIGFFKDKQIEALGIGS
ncbi:MAG TPA: hypothetical protein PKE04_21720, partial [Clostridia bacterium]|nr:hypothetical protein [Clostridia bacterium]